jgi:hypothetical protein
MRKLIFVFTVVFILPYCKEKDSNKQKLIPYVLSEDWDDIETLDHPHPWDVFAKCVDSARQFRSGMQLPSFFSNHRFDCENPFLTDHLTASIRKMVFDSIQNIDLLNAIVNSDDSRLRLIVNSNTLAEKGWLKAIPYRNVSTYEMAKNRLLELGK